MNTWANACSDPGTSDRSNAPSAVSPSRPSASGNNPGAVAARSNLRMVPAGVPHMNGHLVGRSCTTSTAPCLGPWARPATMRHRGAGVAR